MFRIEKTADSKSRKVIFILPDEPGKKLFLVGSFNFWDSCACMMEYSAAEQGYVCEQVLPVGVYEYKFICDGEWMLDDGNPNFTANDFGTLNSVLDIQ